MRHALAVIVAAITLLAVGSGTASANRSGSWEVIAAPIVCPQGFLCKRFFYEVRNYGQAVVLALRLQTEGWQVTIEPAPVPS